MVAPVTSSVVSRVTAWSTFNVPFTVVITPDFEIFTIPPSVANEVAPLLSKVDTDVSPITSSVLLKVVAPIISSVVSRVTAWSTFNVPLTVVITPDLEIFTIPPPVANEVAPLLSKVDTNVSPVTSNVLSRVVAPVIFVVPST